MLWLLEAFWEAHLSWITWGKLLHYKPISAWNYPLLDSNVWVQNDQAVIMQSWRNVQNTGVEEKRSGAGIMIFQRHLSFYSVRRPCTGKTFWFTGIIWNYPNWGFSEKENGRVLITVATQVPLLSGYVFFSPFSSIFTFCIKIVMMEMIHDRYCLELDIQSHWHTKYLLTVSFLHKTSLQNCPHQ